MKRYLVISPRNLEDITLNELKEHKIKILDWNYRKIKIESNKPEQLLQLKSPDDMLIFISEFKDTDHYIGKLDNILQKIKDVNLTEAIKLCKQIREIKEQTFAVTVSVFGERKFKQEYLKLKISNILKTKNLIPTETKPEIDFHIILFYEHIYLGIRLTKNPLYKRYYKVKALKGSLKANIAHCMLKLANIKSGETVLDPFCGAGTIPIEAALLGCNSVGYDINDKALKLARRNSGRAKTKILFEVKDSRNTNLKPNSIDKIVSNLPFNKQIEIESPAKFLGKILQESERILKPDGKIVFLTTHGKLISELLKKTNLKLTTKREISLFGLKPMILIMGKKLT